MRKYLLAAVALIAITASTFATTPRAQELRVRERLLKHGISHDAWPTFLGYLNSDYRYNLVFDGTTAWNVTTNTTVPANCTVEMAQGTYMKVAPGKILTLLGGFVDSGGAMWDGDVRGLAYAREYMWVSNGADYVSTAVTNGEASYFASLSSETIDQINTNYYTINQAFEAVSNDFVTLETYINGPDGSNGVIAAINSNTTITVSNFSKANFNWGVSSNALTLLADAVNDALGGTDTVDFVLNYATMDVTNYTALPSMPSLSFPDLRYAVSNIAIPAASNSLWWSISSNNTWLAALQLANDTINSNFTAVSNQYAETTNVVNQHADLINTNAYIANTNMALLNTNLILMFSSIWGALTNLDTTATPTEWFFPWEEAQGGAATVTGTLSLGTVDLVTPIQALASNQVVSQYPTIVSTTIQQIVVQSVNISPWTYYNMGIDTTNNTQPVWVDSVQATNTPWDVGEECEAMYITGLSEGLYSAQGHWGPWTNAQTSPFIMFGGYPPAVTTDNATRKYLYIYTGGTNTTGRRSGEFSFLFNIDTDFTGLAMYTAITNRANSTEPPVFLQFIKWGIGQ